MPSDGVRAEEIKESLQQDIQEELTHAEQLGNRLKQLDTRPPDSAEFTARQDSLQPPEDSTDVLSVIREGSLTQRRTLSTRIGHSWIPPMKPVTRLRRISP